MPIDKEKSKCGGFQLTVKTARKNRKVDGKTVQQVVLSDPSGEIPGDIFMSNPKQCSYLPRATVINILVCWLQPGENGPKLYVDEWFLPKTDGEGNPVYRNGIRGYGDLPPDYYDPEEEYITRSKIRMHIVCAMIQAPFNNSGCEPWKFNKEGREFVNKVVDFIMTGE